MNTILLISNAPETARRCREALAAHGYVMIQADTVERSRTLIAETAAIALILIDGDPPGWHGDGLPDPDADAPIGIPCAYLHTVAASAAPAICRGIIPVIPLTVGDDGTARIPSPAAIIAMQRPRSRGAPGATVTSPSSDTERNELLDSLFGLFSIAPGSETLIDANDTFARLAGYESRRALFDDAGFRPLGRFVNPDDGARARAALSAYGQVLNEEVAFYRSDGSIMWARYSARGRSDGQCIEGIIEDISERRNREDYYRLIADNTSDVIWTTNFHPDVKVTFVSPSIERITGETVEEHMNGSINTRHTPEDVAELQRIIQEEMAKEQDPRFDKNRSRLVETRLKRKDGSLVPVEYHVKFQRDERGAVVGLIGNTRVITERKQAEEKLKTLIENLKRSQQISHVGDWSWDLRADRFTASEEGLRIMGFPLNHAPTYAEVSERLHPDDRERARDVLGTSLATGDPYQIEIRVHRRDTGELRHVLSMAEIEMGDDGRPIRVFGINHDITERKRAEEENRLLQESLLHAQKMEAIGTLAGGIAHNFNNILMGIMGNTSLLMTSGTLSADETQHLRNIEEYVRNATALTKNLLGFAMGGKYELKPTDLNELVSGEIKLFMQTRKEIIIHPTLQKDLFIVDSDQGQIRQALLNLFINAWQAMPDGGDIYLETANIILGENDTTLFDLKPGRHVRITITDTGIGMDRETQERLFIPFFTTKAPGDGTGLGLASVYGIITNHGGTIRVYSEKGKGTTFTIMLPASDSALPRASELAAGELITGSGTVLIVDDEPLIITTVEKLLTHLGYSTLVAGSGHQAIELFHEKRDRIDLVILDLVMPGMGGGETYNRLKEIDPGVKVLLASGYSIDGQAREIMNRGCNGFIQKPYSIKELSTKVRAILTDAGPLPLPGTTRANRPDDPGHRGR